MKSTNHDDDDNTQDPNHPPHIHQPWTTIPTLHQHQPWLSFATKPHPNKQHIPFTTGRGPTSARRYRRRISRRREPHAAIASNTQPIDQLHTLPYRTRATTARIHTRTNNILLRTTTDNDTHNNHITIEKLIADIYALSDRFDTTHARLTSPTTQTQPTPPLQNTTLTTGIQLTGATP